MMSGGGKGARAVASHDEDTTTLGVEAARLATKGAPTAAVDALWFATSSPAYLDKTNATAVAAALRLPSDVPAYDFGGALRSGIGCLLTALRGGGTTLVVGADTRDGLPTSADESAGGDAGAAALIGEGDAVVAEFVASASATDEFTDRWRSPGSLVSKLWEERFGENRYVALGQDAFARALKAAGLETGEVGRVIVTGMHARAVTGLRKRLQVDESALPDDLSSTVGQAGAAHPLLVLASVLESLSMRKVRRRRRSLSCCTWPMVPMPWSCARPTPWRRGGRCVPLLTRSTVGRICPIRNSWPGGGSCPPNRRADPSRLASRARRPTGARSGSSASSVRVIDPRERCTCLRRGYP